MLDVISSCEQENSNDAVATKAKIFFIAVIFITVASPVRWVSIKTESVEMISVYLIESSGMPEVNKRYNNPTPE